MLVTRTIKNELGSLEEGFSTIQIDFIQLAQRNTPIHRWHIPNLPEGFSLSIKRDDLTGSTLSGNKVKKKDILNIFSVKSTNSNFYV